MSRDEQQAKREVKEGEEEENLRLREGVTEKARVLNLDKVGLRTTIFPSAALLDQRRRGTRLLSSDFLLVSSDFFLVFLLQRRDVNCHLSPALAVLPRKKSQSPRYEDRVSAADTENDGGEKDG